MPASVLTSKTWKRGMVDKNPSTNPYGGVQYYPVQNCEKDDTFKFGSNNKLAINQGTNKCNSNEPATKTVSYSYTDSNKELIIDGTKYIVAEESKAQIKYYAPVPTSGGFSNVVFLLE